MKLEVFAEPELEFGSGRHIDIRYGIASYGPFDSEMQPIRRSIRLGIVGTQASVEALAGWLSRCRTGIPEKPSPYPQLFAPFPGCSTEVGYRCDLSIGQTGVRTVSQRELSRLVRLAREGSPILAATEAGNYFASELGALAESNRVDVLVCAPPDQLLAAFAASAEAGHDNARGLRTITGNFRAHLKARSMAIGIPVQLVWPTTYGDGTSALTADVASLAVNLQDEATRAWNFHTALYYKAGRAPWRLKKETTEFATCYVGVSFFESVDESALDSSVAQIFNERGDGIIVRGGPAVIDSEDRQPHLSEEDAERLLADALSRYRLEHHTMPARCVVHKSSNYTEAETRGFQAATEDARVDSIDLLAIGNSDLRVFRYGRNPPLRGTVVYPDPSEAVVYTRGSVPFFRVYPGLYIPRPLRLVVARASSSVSFLSGEILALTKLNWNSTQFDQREPITVRAARHVASILRAVGPGDSIQSRYAFYM